VTNSDKLVKSRKTPLQSFWTPVFTGVTTYYETINNKYLKLERRKNEVT